MIKRAVLLSTFVVAAIVPDAEVRAGSTAAFACTIKLELICGGGGLLIA